MVMEGFYIQDLELVTKILLWGGFNHEKLYVNR